MIFKKCYKNHDLLELTSHKEATVWHFYPFLHYTCKNILGHYLFNQFKVKVHKSFVGVTLFVYRAFYWLCEIYSTSEEELIQHLLDIRYMVPTRHSDNQVPLSRKTEKQTKNCHVKKCPSTLALLHSLLCWSGDNHEKVFVKFKWDLNTILLNF